MTVATRMPIWTLPSCSASHSSTWLLATFPVRALRRLWICFHGLAVPSMIWRAAVLSTASAISLGMMCNDQV